ncbi:Uncharacterised protein [Mycobacteroides abscessus subsp. abscessus]|nr:Uncharacterised protein [Mycobacteroides abscessus subsp. abscessus]
MKAAELENAKQTSPAGDNQRTPLQHPTPQAADYLFTSAEPASSGGNCDVDRRHKCYQCDIDAKRQTWRNCPL